MATPLKVILIGTGGVGGHALRGLIANPQYKRAGVWVSSDAKAARDAGELAGLDISTEVIATTDLDALLANKPDCAV